MFTLRLSSMLPSPVFPCQPVRRDTSDRQHVHSFWLTLVFYSLLIQHFPMSWITPPSPVNLTQEKSSQGAPKIYHQFTSAGHVLGFGAGQVVVGHPTHALTMTLVKAKPVEPVAIFEHHPKPSLSRHPGESRGPEELPASIDTGFRRYDGQGQPFPVPGPSARPFTGSVRYDQPWPGVSVIYRLRPGAILKSEYRLAPGFSSKTINQIRIRYNRPVMINTHGNLVVRYDSGIMQESAPVAWQEISGKKLAVIVKFRLRGKQTVGFSISGYDPKHALVIDPSLTWNTFLGGTGTDYGYGIFADGSGNVYVSGYSLATWGSPVRAYTGGGDAFAAKLDSSGNLIWNTFLGGAGSDAGNDIAADGSGNVFVGGYSNAPWGSPARAYTSGVEAFAAKLDSSGNLIWNTFLGGTGDDYGHDISLDGSGHVYVGGYSFADWGSPVRAYTSGADAMAAKLDNSGNLIWNTFLGGAGGDYIYGISVDGSGQVYIGSYSNATWGSPIRAYISGNDACAAKLDSNGNLIWNTFLGGTGDDYGRDISLDGSGNVYAGGYSDATWGSPVRAYTSGDDAFAAKLDSSGNLIWNTFLGGNGADDGYGISADGSGNVYVGGYSSATWGSPVRAYTNGNDAMVVKMSDADLTQTCTPTSTITLTRTPTPSMTYTSTATPSLTPTLTLSPTATRSSTATYSPSISPTPSRTPSPGLSPTFSPTCTSSSTSTSSPSITCSSTPSPVLSASVTATQTPTLNPVFLSSTPTPISSTQDFVRLRSHVLHINRGDSLALTLFMSQAGQVNIRLYDLAGWRVMNMMDSQQPAGTQLITRDLSALGSGTYILLAEAGGQRARFKVVVLH